MFLIMEYKHISVPPEEKIFILKNTPQEGKGEILRAGKPRDEDDVEEDRHQVELSLFISKN